MPRSRGWWHRMNTSRREPNARRAMILIGVYCLLWAIIEATAGYAGVPGQEVVFVRYGTQLVFLLVFFGPRYGRRLYQTPRPGPQVARSLAMFGMPLLFLAAAARVSTSTAWAIFWVAPLLAMTFDRRPAVGPARWLAAMAGFAGVLLILDPGRPITPGAVVFAIGMAVCFAVYQQLTKMVADEPEVTNLFHAAFWVFLLLGPLAIHGWREPTATGWADLVMVGLLGFAAIVVLDIALQHASPATIAPAFYLQPAIARLLDWSAHGVRLSRGSVVGSGIVLASVVIASRLTRAAAPSVIARS